MADLKPIIVATKFGDTNNDGIITFGKANKAKYGATTVIYQPALSKEGAYVYWPEGYVPPAPPVVEISRPIPPAKPVTTSDVDFGGAGRLTGWKTGAATGLHIQHALDVITVQSPFTGLRVSDVAVDSCREFITMENWQSRLYDAQIRKLVVAFRKRGIYVRGDSDVLIEDAVLRMTSVNKETGIIPQGIQLGAKVADGNDAVKAIIRRCIVEDVQSNLSSGYENGDGFMSEDGDAEQLFEDCIARRCVDAGFDIKGRNRRLDHCVVEETFLGFKLWNSNHHGHLTVINPKRWGHNYNDGVFIPGSKSSGKACSGLTLLGPTDKTKPPTEIVIDHLQLNRREGASDIHVAQGRVHLIVRSSNLKRSELFIKDTESSRLTLEWPA